ncbi:MAG: hypothetical protein ABSE57_01000 [Bryobacteraceae bacterium]
MEGWDRISIELSKASGELNFAGDAHSLGPTDEPITGQFSGPAVPLRNHVHLTDQALNRACAVDLTLAGEYLRAKDNGKCSATYVRFWGIWKRARVETNTVENK